nr:MAG TPA: hypothetical protein [Caudoviricetes sp.]
MVNDMICTFMKVKENRKTISIFIKISELIK